MKPVCQTRFGRPHGNCWAACIASILELPVEAVDWSADMTAGEIELPDGSNCTLAWVERQERKLLDLGYWMARQPYDPALQMPAGVHYLMLGYTRGRQRKVPDGHVWVGLEGRVVHDPNPNGVGLGEIDSIAFLVRR